MSQDGRQDPFQGLSGEAVDDLVTGVVPTPLQHPPTPGGRRTPLRPSERRRKRRMLTITFSSADIPRRLRALAERWGMLTAAGRPNHSAVVEYLLLSRLEAAERGEIPPPALANSGPSGGAEWF